MVGVTGLEPATSTTPMCKRCPKTRALQVYVSQKSGYNPIKTYKSTYILITQNSM
jgi:hypothetical protein